MEKIIVFIAILLMAVWDFVQSLFNALLIVLLAIIALFAFSISEILDWWGLYGHCW